jgi:alkylation response protein AidB-like acyl-CoA dehydrogenase
MSDIFTSDSFRSLLETLQQQPCEDVTSAWPRQHLMAMAKADVLRWDIPVSWNGLNLQPADMLEGLRLLSSACLVSTFVLTQRTAAVRRIATSTNLAAQERLLPALRDGKAFATVGISHLTTSGQHLKTPLVRVTPTDAGFELSGTVPWATGATQADYLITGGALSDGRQILAAIPTDRIGVQVQSPVTLMALNASQTGAVKLNQVAVTHDEVLHGPVEAVMQQGTGGGAGSLGTSALAIGATGGTLRGFALEAKKRPDLNDYMQPLQDEHDQLLTDLRLAAADMHANGETAAEGIRRRANSMVLRSAQAWLAATKGAGFVAGHPAERAVRESLFFLVWSCPQSVLAANLHELACTATH